MTSVSTVRWTISTACSIIAILPNMALACSEYLGKRCAMIFTFSDAGNEDADYKYVAHITNGSIVVDKSDFDLREHA